MILSDSRHAVNEQHLTSSLMALFAQRDTPSICNFILMAIVSMMMCALPFVESAEADEPTDAQIPQVNLLPNPSFEDYIHRTGEVCDWKGEILTEGGSAQFIWDDKEAHSGKHSLKIRWSMSKEGKWTNAGWASPGFPAFANKVYIVRGWLKTAHESGNTHLAIAWFNENGWIGNSDNGFFLRGLNDWLEVSVCDVPPKGAKYGRVYFRSDGNGAEAWCDDVSMTIADGSKLASWELVVPNGSFEDGGRWEVDGWDVFPSAKVARVVNGEDVNVRVIDGERCLMVGGDGERMVVSSEFYLHTSIEYVYEVEASVMPIDGKTKVRLGIRWENHDRTIGGKWSDALQVGGRQWFRVLVNAKPPKGAIRGRILIWVGNGNALIDAVKLQLKPVSPLNACEPCVELAIARVFVTYVVHPDRLWKHFERTFSDKMWLKRVVTRLEQLGDVGSDPDMRRFIGAAWVHLGQANHAAAILARVHRAYKTTDLRNDMVWYYERIAKKQLTVKQSQAAKQERLKGRHRTQPASIPTVAGVAAYIGDDTETNGHWVGRYGSYFYILCAMDGYDVCGGACWPIAIHRSTTDEFQPVRRHVAKMDANADEGLWNPVNRNYRIAYWDDRGEVYAGTGPDLIAEFQVPDGSWCLTIYSREHRITLESLERQVLTEARRTQSPKWRYRRFAVQGPLHLRIHIWRDRSLCTMVGAIFLDPFPLLLQPPEDMPMPQHRELIMRWQEAASMLKSITPSLLQDRGYLQRLRQLEEWACNHARRCTKQECKVWCWWIAWHIVAATQTPIHAEQVFRALLRAIPPSLTPILEALYERLIIPPVYGGAQYAYMVAERMIELLMLKGDKENLPIWVKKAAALAILLGRDEQGAKLCKWVSDLAVSEEERAIYLWRAALLWRDARNEKQAVKCMKQLLQQFPKISITQWARVALGVHDQIKVVLPDNAKYMDKSRRSD